MAQARPQVTIAGVPSEDWYAGLGWRLIRWGTRLRQRAERSGRTGLTSPKKKTRTAAARPDYRI
jgi:hypothetical protein